MKHHLSSRFLAAILAVPFWASSASSDERHVAMTGSDDDFCGSWGFPCREINHAVNNRASAGDTIHVYPGVYRSVTITKSIELIAEGGNTSICMGCDTALCGLS